MGDHTGNLTVIAHLRRLLVSAYCWHVVLNCAFMSFVVGMPVALLAPRWLDPERRLPHRIGEFFWGRMVWRLIPFWRLEIEGAERIGRGGPYLVCTNHQSLLDVLVIMSLDGDFKWVSGLRFFKVPMLAAYMRLTGYIAADLKNPFSAGAVLDECGDWLDRGVSVGMFPEGTRSRSGALGTFKPGAFRVAVDKDLPVLPVAIEGTRDILPKGGSLYLGDSPFKTIRVRVLDPIEVSSLDEPTPVALSRACRAAIGAQLGTWRGISSPEEQAAAAGGTAARTDASA